MKTSKGFNQCFNEQAAVNEDMIIVGAYSNVHVNDMQEFITTIESVPNELAKEISTAIADTGYFSEKNIVDCKYKTIGPIIPTAKEKQNSFLADKLTNDQGKRI